MDSEGPGPSKGYVWAPLPTPAGHLANAGVPWASGYARAEYALALLGPIRRQRTLQPLQHEQLIRPPREDCLHDVRRKQRQPQDPAHLTLRDVLGVADLSLTEV
jgi:hypothetical protein